MGEAADVSVVICAHTPERLDSVVEAVASVLRQTTPAHQVIVSVDHNRELFGLLRARLPAGVDLVANEEVKGLSATRNVAIRAATGDIIAFMDDDAAADVGWLQHLGRRFQHGAVGAVGGQIVPRWLEGGRPGWFPEELDWIVGCTYRGMPAGGDRVRNLIGCNMAFRATVFQAVGPFSTELGRVNRTQGIGEDSELCLRIARNLPHVLIVHEPKAVVHHEVPSWRVTPGYLLRRSYDEGYHKSTVRRLCGDSCGMPLSTEHSYLRHLLMAAIPARLRCWYRAGALAQASAILACVLATGAGYLRGELRKRRPVIPPRNSPAKALGGHALGDRT